MFSKGSFSSISSATVTPSLVTFGAAPALVEHGIAAARAQGAADGPGQLAGAGQQLLPGLVGIRELLGSHEGILSSRRKAECERSWLRAALQELCRGKAWTLILTQSPLAA